MPWWLLEHGVSDDEIRLSAEVYQSLFGIVSVAQTITPHCEVLSRVSTAYFGIEVPNDH